MLQSIRDNSQSIVAKVIVGLIIVTFALFGVESLVSLSSGSNAPATVNGEEISEQELYQATELQRRQLLSSMGENADPALLDENLIRSMVLENLIEQKTLLLSAEQKDMLISDRMIDQMLVNTPDFQQDGKFNPDQFAAVLRNAGFTPTMYRELLRKERLLEQERNAYQLSAFVTPQELERLVALDRQSRDASFFVLPLDLDAVKASITQDELQARFDQDKESLMTEEQVVIEYLLLDKTDLRSTVDVSEAELRAEYDQLLASFQADEMRQVAHILVEISESRDDAAALEKAQALKARLAGGESFESLASAESDDLGSASTGGDLGVNGKGVFSEAFEQTMFALEKGAVSEPVRTEYGYHLIKVLDVTRETAPDFAAAQAQLRDTLVTRKVEALYVERLEQLADVSFSAGDLVEPSDVLGLKIQRSELFGKLGGESDVTRNAKVIAAAFADEQLKERLNSTPIELDRDRSVVIRTVEHQASRQQTLEEVADVLRDAIAYDKGVAQLQAQADDAVAQLEAGASLGAVAAGQTVETKVGITRSALDLPVAVRATVFAMPFNGKPSVSTAVLEDGSVAVVRMSAVNTPAVELSVEERRSLSAFLSSRLGEQDYQALVAELKQRAVVEKL